MKKLETRGAILLKHHLKALKLPTLLPHGWVTGDDEMGRSSRFRAELRRLKERYLLAVPSNTTVRDLEGAVPEWVGRGPHPKRAFEQVRAWSTSLPEGAWRRIEVGDGERGPL